jgi:3',5'-cyclic AMP phosphodiesterase CpdA
MQMQRRDFLYNLGWGLAAGWAVSRWGWPVPAQAAAWPPRLAFLADAHLPDGNARRSEALALARAVAEIRALNPPPDVVLFAGDLAHNGNTKALALGKEILSGLPGPLVAVKGEGDGIGKGSAAWSRLFGESRFSFVLPWSTDKTDPLNQTGRDGNLQSSLLRKTENGKQKTAFQILGLDTSLSASPRGPVFQVGREQRGWLAKELTRLDPNIPLIILSHAPLVEIFRPWQQWTKDGPEVMRLLSRFSQVFCFHGHVHQEAVSSQLSAFSFFTGNEKQKTENSVRRTHLAFTEDRRPKTENHPLPATAWPLPSPLQGTLSAPRPGLGPRGCGWVLVTLKNHSLQYQPQVWQA